MVPVPSGEQQANDSTFPRLRNEEKTETEESRVANTSSRFSASAFEIMALNNIALFLSLNNTKGNEEINEKSASKRAFC